MSKASTSTSKFADSNVTFRGTSKEVELFPAPPESNTSTVAKPPLNVDIVVDVPVATTVFNGTIDVKKISATRKGEMRFMMSPRCSENVTTSSVLRLEDLSKTDFTLQ